jgi:hypothetical protein
VPSRREGEAPQRAIFKKMMKAKSTSECDPLVSIAWHYHLEALVEPFYAGMTLSAATGSAWSNANNRALIMELMTTVDKRGMTALHVAVSRLSAFVHCIPLQGVTTAWL